MSSGLLSSAAYKMVSTVLARRSTPVSKVAAGGRHFSAPATLAHSILKVPSTGLVSSSSGRAASTTLYAVRAFVAATAGKQSGTVKFFNSTKGWGFITPADGSADVFVHQTEIHAEGFRSLGDGEEVEFDVQGGSDGKIRAINVTGPDGAYVKGADQSARGHRGGGYGGGDGFGGGDYNY